MFSKWSDKYLNIKSTSETINRAYNYIYIFYINLWRYSPINKIFIFGIIIF